MSVRIDMMGMRFTRLVVYRKGNINKDRRLTWWCKCDCGNRLKVIGKDLRNGHTMSCGCLQKQRAGFDRRKPDMAARQLFAKTRGRAKKHGWAFELSFSDFIRLSGFPCVYCGRDLFSTNRYKGSEFRYNGLDRINNLKGYTKDNSAPCCKLCNTMKSDLSVDVFLDQIERIYAVNFLRKEHAKD